MRGICGWFSNERIGDGEETLRRMIAAHHGAATDPESKTMPQAGLSIFGAVARPSLLEVDGYLLAAIGHPRLRGADRATGNLLELARRLRAGGKEALSTLGGDFAVASWDSRSGRGLLAVDRTGVHPLMYAQAPSSLVFGSTLDMLFGHPGVQRRLSAQGTFDYLYYHVCPGPGTIYEGARRLLPGECVEFDSRTDSSTVSGTLSRVRSPPARTFSIGFECSWLRRDPIRTNRGEALRDRASRVLRDAE